MEIILVLGGIIIIGAFLFILIEYPYYLVSLFVFLHLYGFNRELPIPLDLRGILSVFLFFRLIIFDKNNLNLIKHTLFTEKFFILIIIFSIYTVLIDFFNNVSMIAIIRTLVLNMISLFLGFLVIINGYTKKTIVLAIIVTGIFATADLIYSYFVLGSLRVRRIIEHFLLGETLTTMNHGFFGELVGYALIITLLSLMTKNLKKSVGYTLIFVFSLGVLISTSRSTALSVILTIAIILLTQKALEINFKKLFFSAIAGLMILFVVALSYSYILKAMNISSEFSEQIYWRLVEEPLSIFKGDVQEFGLDDNTKGGSMRWRYYKYLEDMNKIFSQSTDNVLFGFGAGGYKNIGEMVFDDPFNRQYGSHNFYINLISEYGIVGLILFMFFFVWLLLHTLKKIKQGLIQFSLVYVLVSMFIITFSDNPNLTDKISFIFYGCVIAELLQASGLNTYQSKMADNSYEELAENYQHS